MVVPLKTAVALSVEQNVPGLLAWSGSDGLEATRLLGQETPRLVRTGPRGAGEGAEVRHLTLSDCPFVFSPTRARRALTLYRSHFAEAALPVRRGIIVLAQTTGFWSSRFGRTEKGSRCARASTAPRLGARERGRALCLTRPALPCSLGLQRPWGAGEPPQAQCFCLCALLGEFQELVFTRELYLIPSSDSSLFRPNSLLQKL